METTYTTGQAAEICGVASRTVSKWFDSGLLRGHRLPGSNDRRITRSGLIAFMKERGMPTNELENTIHRILLVGITDPSIIAALTPKAGDDDWEPTVAHDSFEAGIFCDNADIMIIDCKMQGAISVIHGVRKRRKEDCRILAIKDQPATFLGALVDEEFGLPVIGDVLKARLLHFMRTDARRERKAS